MNEYGGVEVQTSMPDIDGKIIKITDAAFFYTLRQLEKYGQAVKVVDGFDTHVAIRPYRLIIDGRSSTNKKIDLYNVIEELQRIPEYAPHSNVQYILVMDEESEIPKNVFGDIS